MADFNKALISQDCEIKQFGHVSHSSNVLASKYKRLVVAEVVAPKCHYLQLSNLTGLSKRPVRKIMQKCPRGRTIFHFSRSSPQRIEREFGSLSKATPLGERILLTFFKKTTGECTCSKTSIIEMAWN